MYRLFYVLLSSFLITFSMLSCADDDDFSLSTGNLLTFSADTVSLDTVFSRVPTATKSFWVYNKSGSGIRCSNVRLEKGNQTGFRVNVDGSFLGASDGYMVNGIEIRNRDSVRVFVELTSPTNNKDVPTLLTENLVFNLESGAQQMVCLQAYTWDAEMYHDLVVSDDMTIESSKPIIIYGGITVAEGATLTLKGGTTLYFHENAGIDVYGRLVVEGEPDQNVVLRGDRIDHMFDYLPYDRVSGQWQGIKIHQNSYENSINYADIHSTYHGIVCDSSDVSRLKLNLYNSIVHNCQGYGLLTVHSVVDVVNCQITNTLDDCIAFYGGVGRVLHSTIAQFYPFDANRGVALRFTNCQGDQKLPLYDFSCINSIVTGYADDVVMGEFDEETYFQYNIDHCLMRTPAIEDTTYVTNMIWENPEDTVSVAGYKHFKVFDTDNLIYDFRLDSLSTAIGKAIPLEMLPYDRMGIRRDEEPDLGCYEYIKEQ